MSKTWFDNLPTYFTFMEPLYCETCGDYGVSLDIDLAAGFPEAHGEWGCTGGFGWYPDDTYTGADLYTKLAEAGYDESMRFDKELERNRPAWLAFLAEIKNDHTPHAIPDDQEDS